MALFGFLKKDNEKQGITFDQAKALREKFLELLQQDDRSKQFNAASEFMLNQHYQDCVDAYQKLMEKYPDSLGDCESQIGAAYYFLGEYEKAISYYVAARNHGADQSMMDDNIWEACETLYDQSSLNSDIERYLQLCPDGSYANKAKKILQK